MVSACQGMPVGVHDLELLPLQHHGPDAGPEPPVIGSGNAEIQFFIQQAVTQRHEIQQADIHLVLGALVVQKIRNRQDNVLTR